MPDLVANVPQRRNIHWNEPHTSYRCADECVIEVPRAEVVHYYFVDDGGDAIASGPKNGVVTLVNHHKHARDARASVAGQLYSREQCRLFSSEHSRHKVFTAPKSLITVYRNAFSDHGDIRSVRLQS